MGVFLIAMMIPFFGCSSTDEGTFDGEVISVTQDQLVVKGDAEEKTFSTSEETAFDLGEESELTMGDMVSVAYHSDGDSLVADSVAITKAVEPQLTMDGEVTDLNDTELTVSSDSLTVVFDYDADTTIEGDLNEGDEVSVIYQGDLNEEPYAVSVKVLKEQADDPHYEAHGIVSDVSDTSVLLSIDSSDSERFVINSETEIDSSDQKIEIGDRAEITFTGDINDNPVATKIIVHHQAKPDQNAINGTLDKAEKTYLELNTGKHTYKILVNESTKFTGNKYKAGVKATVTYSGTLGNDPLALSVYCDKDKNKPKPKPTKTTEKPTETKTKTETQTETDPPTPPTPVIITAQGVIEEWGDNTCTIKIDDENSVELTTENATATPGYFPQVGDTVQFEYDEDKMDLIDIQLLDRPDPDPQTPPDKNESANENDKPTEATTQATTAAPTTTTTTTTTTTAAPQTDPQDDGEDE